MKYLFVVFLLLLGSIFAEYPAKIGEIVYIEGIKKNIVTGYGLVAGLKGTGDSLNHLTQKTIHQYLSYLGVKSEERSLRTKNTAVVAVTAELTGLYEKGDLVDVHVASIGDAGDIENGLLIQTTLKSAGGETYVVASGIIESHFGGDGSPTRGVIADGGIVEAPLRRVEDPEFRNGLLLNLRIANIHTANQIKKIIEKKYPRLTVTGMDPKKITIEDKEKKKIDWETVSTIFNETVSIEPLPKVIVDKNTGIVVVAPNVHIDSICISLPEMSISLNGENQGAIHEVLKGSASVSELAEEFSRIGLSPRKIISIFIALKKSGAMNAEIITQ